MCLSKWKNTFYVTWNKCLCYFDICICFSNYIFIILNFIPSISRYRHPPQQPCIFKREANNIFISTTNVYFTYKCLYIIYKYMWVINNLFYQLSCCNGLHGFNIASYTVLDPLLTNVLMLLILSDLSSTQTNEPVGRYSVASEIPIWIFPQKRLSDACVVFFQ